MNCYGVQSLEVDTQVYLSRLLMNYNHLRRIRAMEWMYNSLSKPGIQRFANLGLQLNWNHTVWQVDGFRSRNGMLKVVTKTRSTSHSEKMLW